MYIFVWQAYVNLRRSRIWSQKTTEPYETACLISTDQVPQRAFCTVESIDIKLAKSTSYYVDTLSLQEAVS